MKTTINDLKLSMRKYQALTSKKTIFLYIYLYLHAPMKGVLLNIMLRFRHCNIKQIHLSRQDITSSPSNNCRAGDSE